MRHEGARWRHGSPRGRRWAFACIALFSAAAAAGEVPAPAEPSSESFETAISLLRRAVEVRGEAASWAQLKEVRRAGTFLYPSSSGDKTMLVSLRVAPPDSVRLETREGDAVQVRLLDQAGAWEEKGGTRLPLDAQGRSGLLRLLRTDEALLARNALDGSPRVIGSEAAGPGELPPDYPSVAGIAVLLREEDGSVLRLILPEAGGLPLRLDYGMAMPDGTRIPVSEAYRDWRPVRGLLFPHETLLFRAGQALGLMRYERIEIDVPPPPGP